MFANKICLTQRGLQYLNQEKNQLSNNPELSFYKEKNTENLQKHKFYQTQSIGKSRQSSNNTLSFQSLQLISKKQNQSRLLVNKVQSLPNLNHKKHNINCRIRTSKILQKLVVKKLNLQKIDLQAKTQKKEDDQVKQILRQQFKTQINAHKYLEKIISASIKQSKSKYQPEKISDRVQKAKCKINKAQHFYQSKYNLKKKDSRNLDIEYF